MIEEIDPNDPAILFDDNPFTGQTVKTAKVALSPQEAVARTAKVFAPIGVGLVLIWFGLTSTGSYFTSATKFGGFLAGVFYGWQFGNLLAMAGAILIYDAIKRSGYL